MTSHSIDVQKLDGPRLIRREELAASHRLDILCFPGLVDDIQEKDLIASYTPLRRGGTQVICHQGVPVCQMSLFHGQLNVYGHPLQIGSVGGVGTHPDYRGLRLATRLLDYCTHKLVDEGARLMLISGTRGLYTRAGFVTAQDFEYVVLKPDSIRSQRDDVSIRSVAEVDRLTCARIYQKEAVHFVRRAEDFVQHSHFCQREGRHQVEDWIVEVAGQPIAYLLTSVPWVHIHDQGTRVREMLEYAGSRTALVDAIPEMMARPGLRELWLFVPRQDIDLRQLLYERGITGDRVPLPGHTMRIINFPGLMSDLRPYVRARLTARQRRGLRFEQADGRYRIVRGREQIELDGAAMTRLVMGIPADMDSDLPTVSGTLGEIVSALFPLPSFLPGLNYH